MVPLRNSYPTRIRIGKCGLTCRTLRKVHGLPRPSDHHSVFPTRRVDLSLDQFWLHSKGLRQLPITVFTGRHTFSERQNTTSTSSFWLRFASDAWLYLGTREAFQLFDSAEEQVSSTRKLESDPRSNPG
ncbi:hypothetical protein NPIL_703341 [Nephila pilipes]|uniref:Uncharacterized protein n=1 Tax=Nephila pilipes TaxID=299642 RepID=A0A8X6PQG6_NEPPI|nr:hypothetical protein NPIL_703341 [Nephila pilipes]